MSIHFLFTKSTKIGSKLIRWGLNEDSSHFAIGFDLGVGDRGVIFHSNFHGLAIAWAKDFREHNEIVYELSPVLPLKLEAEERLYQAVVKNYGSPYDFKGFTFFVLAAIRQKMFGKRIPKLNPWGDYKSFLCTEVAEAMAPEIDEIFKVRVEFSRGVISPDKLYYTLRTSPLLKVTHG